MPITAVLHHAVFDRQSCMLRAFGEDYTPKVVAAWLAHDPSPHLAVAGGVLLFLLGRRWTLPRILVAPAFVSLLPVSVWVWDLPFTGRLLCRTFHNTRLGLRGWHLYLVSALIYGAWVAALDARRRQPASARTPAPVPSESAGR